MIPYGRQDISQADIDAVTAVLRSDFLTQGPAVPRFEEAVARYCDVPHAVAVNSATSALHVACLALGIGPGDRVWTSPISFVASANCALYCGASVDFVDVAAGSVNLCPRALEAKLLAAERGGQLPKLVTVVHFGGEPCEMPALADLARRFGFRLIEDASHAIGARHDGHAVGSCAFSDVTVFSFHPVKLITTAEGGIATTRDAELAARMSLFRSHGVTRDPQRMDHPSEGPWYYEQQELGYNYRMTELQAALGLSQLTRLDTFLRRRHQLADRYDRLLADLPLQLPLRRPSAFSALHLYPVRLLPGRTADRRQVFERMRAAGIVVNVHYIPIYRQPYYQRLGYDPADFPEAERYYAQCLTLPLFPALTESQQDVVVAALRTALAP